MWIIIFNHFNRELGPTIMKSIPTVFNNTTIFSRVYIKRDDIRPRTTINIRSLSNANNGTGIDIIILYKYTMYLFYYPRTILTRFKVFHVPYIWHVVCAHFMNSIRDVTVLFRVAYTKRLLSYTHCIPTTAEHKKRKTLLHTSTLDILNFSIRLLYVIYLHCSIPKGKLGRTQKRPNSLVLLLIIIVQVEKCVLAWF